ncbi:MAG TPA: methyltransferase domain-containing protein [Bryobacteraceae bacterium]|nr:methyltransferase domain-containing protein [Bryobacteraceae bacterium]
MAPEYRKNRVCAAKYADYRFWLLLNTHRAARLNLHTEQRSLRILDIGCGPGFFMRVGRVLGHDCHGIDVPEDCFTPLERQVYSEILRALGCDQLVSRLYIERFVPLPFEDQSHDLLTAFLICFNRHRQPDEWGTEEWQFFVNDALRILREGGRLLLELNDNRARYGKAAYYDERMLDYFQSIGTVNGRWVQITKQPTFEEASSGLSTICKSSFRNGDRTGPGTIAREPC